MKKNYIFSLLVAGVFAFASAGAIAAKKQSNGYVAVANGEYDEAVTLLVADVAKGDPAAIFNLALMYHRGLGVPRDEATAVRLYHEAADMGYPWAQEFLAVGYREGWFGLKKSKRQARKWQKKLKKNTYY